MNDTTDSTAEVTYADISSAAAKLEGVVHRTPVLTSRTIDEAVQGQVFFKCENFQRAGAFKFRGAYHALSKLDRARRELGVVTYSSGNHAQAVALAGKLLGVSAIVVMPNDAPAVKIDATRAYGAEIVFYDRASQDRQRIAHALAQERGCSMIPPFDHRDIIAGQGTVAKELLEDTGPLDYLLVPCGGGGLLSGCAIAAHHLSPGISVVGVEPIAGDDVTRSFLTKTLQSVDNPETIADGARTSSAGALTFPLILRHVQAMATVTDSELLDAMAYLWERLKIVVEPTGALAAAALFQQKVAARGKRCGIVVSGGNIDLGAVARLFPGR